MVCAGINSLLFTRYALTISLENYGSFKSQRKFGNDREMRFYEKIWKQAEIFRRWLHFEVILFFELDNFV